MVRCRKAGESQKLTCWSQRRKPRQNTVANSIRFQLPDKPEFVCVIYRSMLLNSIFLFLKRFNPSKKTITHSRAESGIHNHYFCFGHSLKWYEHRALQCEYRNKGICKGYRTSMNTAILQVLKGTRTVIRISRTARSTEMRMANRTWL